MLTAYKKLELINLIDWNSNWDNLSISDKANYCQLKGIGLYMKSMRDKMNVLFEEDKNIIEERGKDNLIIYI
jgi:hypothetical protein